MHDIRPFDPGDVRAVLSAALARGGDFAEIYCEYTVSNSVVLGEGKIKSIAGGVVEGVGLRVVSGDCTGYAHSDEVTIPRMLEAAETASYVAQHGGGAAVAVGHPSRPSQFQSVRIHAPDVEAGQKVELLFRADEAARSVDPRIREVQAGYGDVRRKIVVISSDGVWTESEDELFRLSVSVLALGDGKRESGTDFLGGRYGFEYFDRHRPEDAADNAARQALTKLTAQPAPAGQFPVVVDAGWGGVLVHEGVGHGLEGDFNRKGTSIYAGRIGERVVSPAVTIVDDGTVPHARGSLAVDDEGTPTERTVLIENGILRGFLYDKMNARLMNTRSTGSGRRESFRHVPLPRMRNTFIDAGKDDPQALIASVQRGVFAKSLGGGQVDIVSGNFVFEINEGYLIENGRITAPIRGANLIGNGPDAMQKVVGVGTDLQIERRVGSCGKDGQYVPVGVGQPTILISEMTIGGTQT